MIQKSKSKSKIIIKNECEICGEKHNKKNKKKVECPYEECSKICCAECFVKYLNTSNLNPVCMWCRKDLSLDFIISNTSKSSFDKYIIYRIDIQVDRVETTLPELQEQANEIMKEKKLNKAISDHVLNGTFIKNKNEFEDLKKLLEYFYKILCIGRRTPYIKNCKILKPENWRLWIIQTHERCVLCDMNYVQQIVCKECNIPMCNLCSRLFLLLNDCKCINCNNDIIDKDKISKVYTQGYYNKFFKKGKNKKLTDEFKQNILDVTEVVKNKFKKNIEYTEFVIMLYEIRYGTRTIGSNIKSEKNKKQFIKKCLDNECRGYLSSQWKCGLCDKFFCKDCHHLKNNSHKCDENEKATIALLKTDSKQCPQCGTMIHRYTGCSQVWTPCCKIAFNWNTGEIEKGRIHSPEYYDYIRRTNNGIVPREVGDEPCGGNIDIHILYQAFPVMEGSAKYLEYYHQQMTDITYRFLPILRRNLDNTHLCLLYLIGDISKETWKKYLRKDIKMHEKNNNIYNILNMYVNVMNDLFRNVIDDKNINLFLSQVKNLSEYTNEHIIKINKMYNSSCNQYYVNTII